MHGYNTDITNGYTDTQIYRCMDTIQILQMDTRIHDYIDAWIQ